ncbi:MAG: zf-HC2 domain-containing protein, partial [Ignavibacteriales bacterium]|nr:zf-HC2 domain-containing protein [Ignavibacteriales bacterium]
MTHQEILEKLNDYIDQSLSEAERAEVAEHLKSCESCSRVMQKLSRLISDAASLPKTLQPARDLWNEIEPKLGVQQEKVFLLPSAIRPKGFASRSFLRASVRIAAVLVAAVGTFLLTTRTSYRSWEVARLEGTPTIEENLVAHTGRLGVGQWLETDETSRARIAIADIGNAQIGPNSKLRLLVTRETEHRLEMLRGHMKASVYSPPRIFIVETPSATAVDLGCVYDLFVNDAGNGTIHVTSGEVSMEFNGVESFVPTGTKCETKRGVGP